MAAFLALLISVGSCVAGAQQDPNKTNETNDTELFLVEPTTTSAPTKPTAEFTFRTLITSAASTTKPSAEALTEAIKTALPGVDPATVKAVAVFEINQRISLTGVAAGLITEAIVKDALASQFSTTVENVKVVLVVGRRRLQSGGRMLSAGDLQIDSTIAVADAAEADIVNAAAQDTTAVASGFKAAYESSYNTSIGTTITLPVPTADTPTMEMAITYEVTSSTGDAIVVPSATAFTTNLNQAQNSFNQTVTTLVFEEATTPAPALPSTSAPSAPTTSAPTAPTTSAPSAPSASSSSSPTSAPTNITGSEPESGVTPGCFATTALAIVLSAAVVSAQ